jgi:hypothetical protein
MAFIAVQLRVFLGGEAYVMETAGLTFAEYARKGFWQLSFVAALALAVIAVAAWLAPKRSKQDRWAARVLLGTLCVLSMVVIASALYRMYTYAETYGLTRMRVWIFTVELWLAVLFALVIVCCWKLRAGWLPRAVLGSGALALLGLAAANPDALIARYNIEHEHRLDIDYLRTLSYDAVPEFNALNEEDRECALDDPMTDAYDDDREILSWNLGYERARELNQRYDDGGGSDACPAPWEIGYETDALEEEEEEEEGGFFTAATCDEYDLSSAVGLFGTSASGDSGIENDTARQFADPTSTGGDLWYLQCGYYGPGNRYLLIETEQFESFDAAADEVRQRLETAQGEATYEEVAPLEIPEGAYPLEGYTAWYETPRTHYYVAACDDLLITVRLMESEVDEDAAAVSWDLVEQTRVRYQELE